MLAAGVASLLLLFAFLAPGGRDRDSPERRQRRPVVPFTAAGLAVGGRRGCRGRRHPGLRARAGRRDRSVAAVAVVDGRTAIPGQRPRRRSSGCGVLGAERASPHRARPARQRAAAIGVAGHDHRAGADETRHRSASSQGADRRGARRRQERAGRVAQRGAWHRADHPGRPRSGRRLVVGGPSAPLCPPR